MGQKKKKNENNDSKADGEKKKGNEDKNPITVVLKVDMHCEGCAVKIIKCVRGFEGVESVKAEAASNKLTVVGKVDPSKIREKLEQKTKKKVDLISPQPKKDNNKDNDNKENNNNNKEPKKEGKKPDDKKKAENENKPKQAPETTAVLKVSLHCQGCAEKIRKIVTKTKGVKEMSMDKQKELLTVKGTMNPKALAENLKERLKRPVEIVPPKKEEKKDGGDEHNGGNGNGGGGKKKKISGNGGQEDESGGGGGPIMEGNKKEHMIQPGFAFGYGYGYEYPPYPVHLHAPQMFSDENPNACSIM
ncbi:mediator of RNA polymerase II transcription subunit 12-like [Tripterygium wilfordii]|uniref:Mediator of RNA polymerase II transcription subunit 12-like n=1 Tax=Tripterygium wilfordii TaxID=458696 RepID=A0A7J7DZ68_TRIWF|nr:heavy metal-associated isoprenylated plant protein 3-like [Tripterygium wilfordii]KAF5751569.1 mediator of RNA polymerase II transcription subunit 12-like [Tripterygium wilfordii]